MYRRLKAYTNIDLGIRTLMSIESTLSDGSHKPQSSTPLGIRAKTFTLATQRRLIRQPPDSLACDIISKCIRSLYPKYLFTRPILYCNHEAHNFHRYLLLDFCSCIIDSMVQSGSPWQRCGSGPLSR